VIAAEYDPTVPEAGESLEVAVVDASEQELVGAFGRETVLDDRCLY